MPHDARPAPDEEPRTADAERLFRDAAATPPTSPAEPAAGASQGGYELQGADEPEPETVIRPPAAAPPTRERAAGPQGRPMTLEPSEAVEQTWSRWAEWGPTMLQIAAGATLLALLLYFALGFEAYGLAVFVLFAGGLALAILSYPIFITLERPVRVTPEQAVRDFYGALSHHVPHYRRMWLLLSRAGRTSASYASFEGFRDYWRARLASWRGNAVRGTVPLRFQVIGFKAAKSAGLTQVTASYVVEVFIRGRTSAGPLATYRVQTSLVRGPDRMWYLDLGTLPDG
jgi:HAMP domain-containing protein